MNTDPLNSRGFARDYITGGGNARAFFTIQPGEWDKAVAARNETGWETWTAADAAELAQFNRAADNEAGAQLARKLTEPGTLAIVTGQQPNLLASPLYILYKALTTWAWARKISISTGRAVVPIFWIASDDHDFAELRQCSIVDIKGGIVNVGDVVSRGQGIPPATPAYSWKLDDSAERLKNLLTRSMPRSDVAIHTLEIVADTLKAPATFESAFARLLAHFLAETPVLLLAPRLPCIRRRQIGVISKELRDSHQSFGLVEKARTQLELAGYKPLIQRAPDTVNLFLLTNGIRCRLLLRGNRIIAQNPATKQALGEYTLSELLVLLESSPERFSPNVVTRPVAQDAILPTIAYVGGPGEITYFAQIGAVYEHFGVMRPMILPRCFATLVDVETADSLSKIWISAQDLLRAPDAATARIMPADSHWGELYTGALDMESAMLDRIEKLRASEPAHHPHIEAALAKTTRSITRALASFKRRIERHCAANGSTTGRALAGALTMLTPLGAPQERILSPLCFARDYTPASFAAVLRDKLDFENPLPQIILLP